MPHLERSISAMSISVDGRDCGKATPSSPAWPSSSSNGFSAPCPAPLSEIDRMGTGTVNRGGDAPGPGPGSVGGRCE
jgi:hypothetical protein